MEEFITKRHLAEMLHSQMISLGYILVRKCKNKKITH